MNEHIPTPYRLGELHSWYGRRIEADDSSLVIANVCVQEEGDEGDRTAEFIVLACNSHEELLATAKLARFWLRSHPEKPANSMAQINEAIARSERSLS